MAEFTLNKKQTLRHKEDEVAFSFNNKLKLKLLWSSLFNLHFCLFFKKKDGSVGGVFSDVFRASKSDCGSLDEFPFMLHLGDDAEPAEGDEVPEQINVASLEEIETAYLCIVDCYGAYNESDANFAKHDARVEIQSDSGDHLEVLANSYEEGCVYLVCSIHNRGGELFLKNENKVYDLGGAFDNVPGFELICN